MEAVNSVNLIAALALYQQRRDSAIGLAHITTKQRGLIWYYNALLQKEYKRSFHYGIIQGARGRIKQIKRQVTVDTPPLVAQQLYNEAVRLQQQIERSEKEING